MNGSGKISNLSLCLPQQNVDALADSWLREDCPSFDAAAVAAGGAPRTATLYAKSVLVVAGTKFFNTVFEKVSCTVVWEASDGDFVEASDKCKVRLARVSGAACDILRGERVALNAMTECTSISTAARQAVSAAKAVHWGGIVAGTRKTAPGLRLVQKFGMVVGGMDCHRFDLSGMIMIKDNHIKASGGIAKAIQAARGIGGFSVKVDVEAEDEGQAIEACEGGADIVMLDNFSIDELVRVATMMKNRWPNVLVEASGGINLDSLTDYCVDCVDIISFSINKYGSAVDMSLKLGVETS